MQITRQDEQALRAALRRKPRKVHELRTMLRERLQRRSPTEKPWWHHASALERNRVEYLANNAVARLLSEWKRQGLVDNPVRGTWEWVAK